jgi:protein-S-isoprenylcysteine O-methyltransferase Ste14
MQKVIQAAASLAFLAMLIVPGLDARRHWSTVPLGLSLLGDALVLVGFWVVFQVFRANSYTAATVEVAEAQTLVTTGPYAVVRHPMYAGALLLMLGTPIALGSWWGLAASAVLAGAIVVRLLDEERLLTAELSGYVAYRETTRYRLIPYVW